MAGDSGNIVTVEVPVSRLKVLELVIRQRVGSHNRQPIDRPNGGGEFQPPMSCLTGISEKPPGGHGRNFERYQRVFHIDVEGACGIGKQAPATSDTYLEVHRTLRLEIFVEPAGARRPVGEFCGGRCLERRADIGIRLERVARPPDETQRCRRRGHHTVTGIVSIDQQTIICRKRHAIVAHPERP